MNWYKYSRVPAICARLNGVAHALGLEDAIGGQQDATRMRRREGLGVGAAQPALNVAARDVPD